MREFYVLLLIFNLSLISCFTDLRRFRTYKGSHVRDLLRAMRNKVIIKSCFQLNFDFKSAESACCLALVSGFLRLELFPGFQFLSKRGVFLRLYL